MYYFEAGVNSDCLLSNSITQVQEITCSLGSVCNILPGVQNRLPITFKLDGPPCFFI